MQSKTKELDPILEVNNLFASIENLPILKGATISVNPGEIHAIMEEMDVAKLHFPRSLRVIHHTK